MSTLTLKVGRSCAKARATTTKTNASLRIKAVSSVLLIGGCPQMFLASLIEHIVAHRSQRAEERRPILQVGREDRLHGLLGPFRHQHIEFRRRGVNFVG